MNAHISCAVLIYQTKSWLFTRKLSKNSQWKSWFVMSVYPLDNEHNSKPTSMRTIITKKKKSAECGDEKKLTNLIIDLQYPKHLFIFVIFHHCYFSWKIALGIAILATEMGFSYCFWLDFQFLRPNNAAIKHFIFGWNKLKMDIETRIYDGNADARASAREHTDIIFQNEIYLVIAGTEERLFCMNFEQRQFDHWLGYSKENWITDKTDFLAFWFDSILRHSLLASTLLRSESTFFIPLNGEIGFWYNIHQSLCLSI